ncbi:hypothetical protein SLS58_002669 [Diplodia intermedia]|uniref:C6 zinc finger domain-containing protein n=1 Tax=Diplodia intermedia TaxID=856260 RepID=A0ABR3TYX4_9PEZI
MHGILALSALHLASLHPDRKREYTAQSARHQEVALSRLRTGLFDTTEENCFEHFILAYLVILFTFYSIGNPLVDDDDNDDNDDDDDTSSPTTTNNNNNRRLRHRRHVPLSLHELGQTLFLGQGIFNTISSPETWTWLQRGPLAALFANARHTTPTAANLPADAAGTFPHRLARLAELVARVGGSPVESRARASCMVAVDALRRAFGVAVLGAGGRREASPVWVWLTLLPPDFREHVGREHPVALVVLAHYAAVVRCFGDRWYLAGWSERVLAAIEEALERRGAVGDGDGGGGDAGGERWGEWLEFPKAFGAAELDEAIRESAERREQGVE